MLELLPFWLADSSFQAAGAAFEVLFSSPSLWLFTLFGVLLGMVVGVLPGFGPPAAMALLFPLTYALPSLSAISALAGIFYGAKYGGAVTSILLGIPGEADAVATLFEGRPLALRGKAKQALTVAILASFMGGLCATVGMVALAPFLTAAALYLGPAGRFMLSLGALLLVALLGQGHRAKSMLMVFLGLALALVGLDPVHGAERFTFGQWRLMGGVELTALLLGVFGLGDILDSLAPRRVPAGKRNEKKAPFYHAKGANRRAIPAGKASMGTTKNRVQSIAQNTAHSTDAGHDGAIPPLRVPALFFAALRGAGIGFGTGLVPCGAGVTASFASYALEKKISPYRKRFGSGVWTGLAGPEAANSAAALASFAPLLLLGLPTNPITAALLGALNVGGVVPGPQLPEQQPLFYWGLIFSLLLGNVFLLFMGLGLTRLWARLACLPYHLVWPCVLMLCLVGAWMGTGSMAGPVQCLVFGLCSACLRRQGYPPAPLVLAFVLGPSLESHLAQALMSAW